MSSMMSKSLIGEEIKLGVDMHEKSYVINAKIDGSVPLRSKRMSPSEFFGFVASIIPKFASEPASINWTAERLLYYLKKKQ